MRPRLAHILLALALFTPAAVRADPVSATAEAQGGACLSLDPSIDPSACRGFTHDTITYVGGGPAAHAIVDLAFDSVEPVWDVARDVVCIYQTGDIIHCLVDQPSG
ncbi:MAG: hypothetical protein ACYC2H_07455 [Thermoplasmatota archaeon]